MAKSRILDACHTASDIGLQGRALKSEIGIGVERAVLKNEVVGVA